MEMLARGSGESKRARPKPGSGKAKRQAKEKTDLKARYEGPASPSRLQAGSHYHGVKTRRLD
jgi:hypothetical protein